MTPPLSLQEIDPLLKLLFNEAGAFTQKIKAPTPIFTKLPKPELFCNDLPSLPSPLVIDLPKKYTIPISLFFFANHTSVKTARYTLNANDPLVAGKSLVNILLLLKNVEKLGVGDTTFIGACLLHFTNHLLINYKNNPNLFIANLTDFIQKNIFPNSDSATTLVFIALLLNLYTSLMTPENIEVIISGLPGIVPKSIKKEFKERVMSELSSIDKYCNLAKNFLANFVIVEAEKLVAADQFFPAIQEKFKHCLTIINVDPSCIDKYTALTNYPKPLPVSIAAPIKQAKPTNFPAMIQQGMDLINRLYDFSAAPTQTTIDKKTVQGLLNLKYVLKKKAAKKIPPNFPNDYDLKKESELKKKLFDAAYEGKSDFHQPTTPFFVIDKADEYAGIKALHNILLLLQATYPNSATPLDVLLIISWYDFIKERRPLLPDFSDFHLGANGQPLPLFNPSLPATNTNIDERYKLTEYITQLLSSLSPQCVDGSFFSDFEKMLPTKKVAGMAIKDKVIDLLKDKAGFLISKLHHEFIEVIKFNFHLLVKQFLPLRVAEAQLRWTLGEKPTTLAEMENIDDIVMNSAIAFSSTYVTGAKKTERDLAVKHLSELSHVLASSPLVSDASSYLQKNNEIAKLNTRLLDLNLACSLELVKLDDLREQLASQATTLNIILPENPNLVDLQLAWIDAIKKLISESNDAQQLEHIKKFIPNFLEQNRKTILQELTALHNACRTRHLFKEILSPDNYLKELNQQIIEITTSTDLIKQSILVLQLLDDLYDLQRRLFSAEGLLSHQINKITSSTFDPREFYTAKNYLDHKIHEFDLTLQAARDLVLAKFSNSENPLDKHVLAATMTFSQNFIQQSKSLQTQLDEHLKQPCQACHDYLTQYLNDRQRTYRLWLFSRLNDRDREAIVLELQACLSKFSFSDQDAVVSLKNTLRKAIIQFKPRHALGDYEKSLQFHCIKIAKNFGFDDLIDGLDSTIKTRFDKTIASSPRDVISPSIPRGN